MATTTRYIYVLSETRRTAVPAPSMRGLQPGPRKNKRCSRVAQTEKKEKENTNPAVLITPFASNRLFFHKRCVHTVCAQAGNMGVIPGVSGHVKIKIRVFYSHELWRSQCVGMLCHSEQRSRRFSSLNRCAKVEKQLKSCINTNSELNKNSESTLNGKEIVSFSNRDTNNTNQYLPPHQKKSHPNKLIQHKNNKDAKNYFVPLSANMAI